MSYRPGASALGLSTGDLIVAMTFAEHLISIRAATASGFVADAKQLMDLLRTIDPSSDAFAEGCTAIADNRRLSEDTSQ